MTACAIPGTAGVIWGRACRLLWLFTAPLFLDGHITIITIIRPVRPETAALAGPVPAVAASLAAAIPAAEAQAGAAAEVLAVDAASGEGVPGAAEAAGANGTDKKAAEQDSSAAFYCLKAMNGREGFTILYRHNGKILQKGRNRYIIKLSF